MFNTAPRILILDSAKLVHLMICKGVLQELPDAQVVTLSSGEEACNYLAHCDEPFDLISTSLMLHDMDGLDFTRFIRKTPPHNHTPVVVVSSDADARLEADGFYAGVSEYYDKSLGNDSIVEYILEFSQRNKGRVGNVLYVEDSPTAAIDGMKMMESHGYQVHHVASGEEAKLLLQALNTHEFDIVVTDYLLKDKMTGEDILRYIRDDLHLKSQELPVLIVTGKSNQDVHAEVFRQGATDFLDKPLVEEILIARIKAALLTKQLFARLKIQSEELKAQSEEIMTMAITDSLTGVKNKNYLLEHGDKFIKQSHPKPVSVLITDIDLFKRTNDTFGHLVGDQVLARVGQVIASIVSEEDGHLVCRFGGEEFVVLLGNTPQIQASEIAEEIRIAISEIVLDNHPQDLTITTSVGVCGTDYHDGLSLSELMKLADESLYACKENGRNCVYYSANKPVRFTLDD